MLSNIRKLSVKRQFDQDEQGRYYDLLLVALHVPCKMFIKVPKRNKSDKIFDFKFVEVVSPLSLLSNDQSSDYENQYLNFWNIDQVI